MSTAETIAQIKDIVVILFLGFASLIIVFGAILGLRLYWRVGRFMDRMERFTDGFETAFGSITTARKALGPVMRGSLVVIGTRNKQPYFSVNMKRKTRLIYLGKRRERRARKYSENYHRLQEIIDEMTLINMRLLTLDSDK